MRFSFSTPIGKGDSYTRYHLIYGLQTHLCLDGVQILILILLRKVIQECTSKGLLLLLLLLLMRLRCNNLEVLLCI